MKKPPYKLYCVVSKEAVTAMKGNRGKLVAQGGHAFLHAWWSAMLRFPWAALAYKFSKHAYKITLVVENEAELILLHERYRDQCGTSLVRDAGFTVFERPTLTSLGIGPLRCDRFEPEGVSVKMFV